jgi:hypothetical protein
MYSSSVVIFFFLGFFEWDLERLLPDVDGCFFGFFLLVAVGVGLSKSLRGSSGRSDGIALPGGSRTGGSGLPLLGC